MNGDEIWIVDCLPLWMFADLPPTGSSNEPASDVWDECTICGLRRRMDECIGNTYEKSSERPFDAWVCRHCLSAGAGTFPEKLREHAQRLRDLADWLCELASKKFVASPEAEVYAVTFPPPKGSTGANQ